MTPKKKKIYIAIIVACITISGGLMSYSFGLFGGGVTPPVSHPGPGDIPLADSFPAGTTSPGLDTSFSVPSVFPRSSTYDVSIFESSNYIILKPGRTITVDPRELGRGNPFDKY